MRDFRTFCARCTGAVLAVCLIGNAGEICAQPADRPTAEIAPRGSAAFDRANAAWARGDFDVAEAEFKDAIDQGGLARKDLLKAHVYLGSARAVLGKREGALAALRIAATLDPSFRVPGEAGKKVTRLAETARRERFSPLSIQVEAPSTAPTGHALRVEVSLGPASTGRVGRGPEVVSVSLHVSDGLSTTAPSFKTEQPATPRMTFDLPTKVTTDGAQLIVRASGLDARGNELVAGEAQVHVEPEVTGPVAIAPAAAPRATAKMSFAPTSGASDRDHGSQSGGFWSSPWPWIVGGAILAGAGAGAYFALRPGDEVTVAPVQVQAVR